METNRQISHFPLSGVRVLELGRIIAAPFASQLLADLGAEVVKVERPGFGDESRDYGQLGTGGKKVGAVFATLNRGKHSVTLDLTNEEGIKALRSLIRSSDVLIHNYLPPAAEKLGFDYRTARSINPNIVYCAISGFGDLGPMRDAVANDLLAQAYSGLMSFSGEPGREPVRCPVSVADFTAGFYACIGVLAAIHRRHETGEGGEVSTSLLEGMLTLVNHQLASYLANGVLPQKMGSANLLGQPNQAFKTRDGWLVLSATSDSMWRRCALTIGGNELANDSRFAELAGRYANRRVLLDEVATQLALRTTDEWVGLFREADVICAPILDLAQVAENPQVESLDILSEAEWETEPLSFVGGAIRYNGRRMTNSGAIPALGADTSNYLEQSGEQ